MLLRRLTNAILATKMPGPRPSRRIARFHNPSNFRRNDSRPTNQQNPPRPAPPPKDPLDDYVFNEIAPPDFERLGVFDAIIQDLSEPGKAISYLTNILTVAKNQVRNIGGMHFDSKFVSNLWVGTLTLDFHGTKTFTCKHKQKRECKNLCCLAAIHDLRERDLISSTLRVNIDTSITDNFWDRTRGPVQISPLPIGMKQQMMSFINKFEEHISNLINFQIDKARARYASYTPSIPDDRNSLVLEGFEPEQTASNPTEQSNYESSSISKHDGTLDIFTSRPFVAPDLRKKATALNDLKRVFSDRTSKYHSSDFHRKLRDRDKLPIRANKEEILDAIAHNRVIVVAGETGSGKSTQLPQFIMEDFVQRASTPSYVNIAITQPRRISAISLAERVSQELGEPSVGHTVGHNVRLQSKPPIRNLNIMTFFTTGMLLNKLQRNPNLQGVTHLIIDEVHERDCTIDFLLILIKRLLTRRKDLKVILMSASIDAGLFSRYFDNCPVLSVSGRCYPVQSHYLSDIYHDLMVNMPSEDFKERAPKLNIPLTTDLIRYIDETRPPGAILCFLPGWKEMSAVKEELSNCRSRNDLKVYLTHSKLPLNEQRLIFDEVGPGSRKVILATNIAETSITINDVVYVIDSGLCNSIDYNPEKNMSAFGTRWISRANAKQRAGRAGRTRPGECFKLYNEEDESRFDEFPAPELLRIPLESVIMEAKCHCPQEKVVTFLSQALQHPTSTAIRYALEELTMLGILDDREDLTVLGKRVSELSTPPRMSVALVISSAMRCLYPVLNAVAVMSCNQEPFRLYLNEKSEIRNTKTRLCQDVALDNREPSQYMSDHIAYGNLLAQYDVASLSRSEHEFFMEENNLNRASMAIIQDSRNLYARMLIAAKFVHRFDWYSHDSQVNSRMNDLEFVIASFTRALYPKVVRVIKGHIHNGRMYPNRCVATDIQTNCRVRFVSESVVKHISLGRNPNASNLEEGYNSDEDSDYVSGPSSSGDDDRPKFLLYSNSRMDEESNIVVVKDGSIVSPLTLILFGGRDISISSESNKNDEHLSDSDHMITLYLDRQNLLSFKISREDASVLQMWRDVWKKYLSWYIHTKDTSSGRMDSTDAIIYDTMSDFLETNKKLYKVVT